MRKRRPTSHAKPSDDSPAKSPLESPTVIRVAMHSRPLLAACHMPGIRGEGLFVPGVSGRALYDRVCLVVSLMGAPAVPVMGRVVWVCPAQAVGHRMQGIGVQFEDDAQARLVRDHIRTLLPAATARLPLHSHTF